MSKPQQEGQMALKRLKSLIGDNDVVCKEILNSRMKVPNKRYVAEIRPLLSHRRGAHS